MESKCEWREIDCMNDYVKMVRVSMNEVVMMEIRR